MTSDNGIITFIVERHPNDSRPIKCQSAEEAIATAERIGGVAWMKNHRHEPNGCPVTSWKRYTDGIWEYQ